MATCEVSTAPKGAPVHRLETQGLEVGNNLPRSPDSRTSSAPGNPAHSRPLGWMIGRLGRPFPMSFKMAMSGPCSKRGPTRGGGWARGPLELLSSLRTGGLAQEPHLGSNGPPGGDKHRQGVGGGGGGNLQLGVPLPPLPSFPTAWSLGVKPFLGLLQGQVPADPAT